MQVRTEVLMAVTMKIAAVVWDVMPSNLAVLAELAASISLNDGISVPN